ncbi:MAG: hypothetical protein A2Z18_11030 [Armatimonadetes bacterium RBG_16_58_9]|nr:MAG: hypothetical protein A2Z18_11030 [Armatimonadetes bacterium RBG_16_58_9]
MIFGLLRVRNEARWIDRCVASIQPLCQQIIVFDDHSTDETPAICARMGAHVVLSAFGDLDESRDKDYLLSRLYTYCHPKPGDYALMIDGDEVLEKEGSRKLSAAIDKNGTVAYMLKILYLWDSETTIRTDGVYGRFERPSLFPLSEEIMTFRQTGARGHFHCSNVPSQFIGRCRPLDAAVIHLGYRDSDDRIRKYEWYRRIDGDNPAEDGYRHIVQGDIAQIPAHAKLMHAGPLRLEPLMVAW